MSIEDKVKIYTHIFTGLVICWVIFTFTFYEDIFIQINTKEVKIETKPKKSIEETMREDYAKYSMEVTDSGLVHIPTVKFYPFTVGCIISIDSLK